MRILVAAALAWLSLVAAPRGAAAAIDCHTDCHAYCENKFPKWYQGWDRKRCAAECFDTRPSCMPGPVDLAPFTAEARAYEDRLLAGFVEGGYVVSRHPDGSAEHKGDSVLWSNIAMVVMPCDRGRPTQDAIVASVHARGGALVRFEPLPASYVDNATSRDMETGGIFGFAVRSLKCGGADRDALRGAWALHADFVEDGWLYPTSDLTEQTHYYVTPGLDFMIDLVSHHFGLHGSPSGDGKALFEASLIASVTGVSLQDGSCYPIHLSTLLAITAEKLGRPIKRRVYDDFCEDTAGMDLPLTDWYCRRLDAATWLAGFEPNQYEYRHQRCGGGEGPDVDPGGQSPALDYLILYYLAGGQ